MPARVPAGPIGELELLGDSLHAMPDPAMAWLFSYAVGGAAPPSRRVLELGFGLTERWGVQVKLPYQSASGDWAPTAAWATR